MEITKKPLGKTGLTISNIVFGTSSLGSMPAVYGHEVDAEAARQTVRAIFDGPANVIDTSRLYGNGRSEERIGDVIRERGGLPEGFILATKLDRDPDTGRFDGAAARRSLEDSLKALGVERFHILHLHDPEFIKTQGDFSGPKSSTAELMKMKEEGFTDAVGLAAGDVDVMMPLLRDWNFDALLTHNRFTLLNRNAEEMIDFAITRGMAVFNAAPYGGGMMAKGSGAVQRYAYREAPKATMDAVRQIEAICAKHGVPVGAAALQFSMREPRINATVVGVSKPERVAQTIALATHPIPEGMWEELAAVPFSRKNPQAA